MAKGKKGDINCQLPGAELLEQGKSVEEVMASLQDDLSPEHDRFCREYILDDNQTRAYMRAYPNSTYGSAATSAWNLLKKPEITARILTLREERNKRLEISADKVLRRLEARASVTPRDFYKADGSFIPVHELDPDVAIGIKSIEVAELYEGNGESKQAIGLIRKITMVDGKASDELIGRNLKMWTDKVEVSGELTLADRMKAARERVNGNKPD